MKNEARKQTPTPYRTSSIALVNTLEIRDRSDRSWFKNFLRSLFSSPDLDLSQFERLETKRTSQQMRREAGIYWGQ
jgi:hypothetical protein